MVVYAGDRPLGLDADRQIDIVTSQVHFRPAFFTARGSGAKPQSGLPSR